MTSFSSNLKRVSQITPTKSENKTFKTLNLKLVCNNSKRCWLPWVVDSPPRPRYSTLLLFHNACTKLKFSDAIFYFFMKRLANQRVRFKLYCLIGNLTCGCVATLLSSIETISIEWPTTYLAIRKHQWKVGGRWCSSIESLIL